MKNIVLIGFMGTGKTAVGRSLSAMLGYAFAETDDLIKEATGLAAPQVLKKYGERRFRSEEELIFKKLAQKEKQVVATGVNLLWDDQLAILKGNGFLTLLEASADTLQKRLARKNSRSAACDKPSLEKLQQLAASRREGYLALADLVINTSEVSVEEAAKIIAGEYERFVR
ncbi:MAG: AAA family ATPase [Clostridiales bacterium]|nr:AAA family ATPase [Clostridiales bacterium]